MKHCSIDVKELQMEKKLLRRYAEIHNERVALTADAARSMKSIELWRGNDSIRSRAMSIARLIKVYADKPLVSMEKLVQKCGVENSVEIAETILNELRSIRFECNHTWNKLIASAMKRKVFSIRSIRATVKNIIRRVMNHFRTPRTHRSRRFRLAVASAGSGGDDAGPDGDGPDVAPGVPFLAGGARA